MKHVVRPSAGAQEIMSGKFQVPTPYKVKNPTTEDYKIEVTEFINSDMQDLVNQLLEDQKDQNEFEIEFTMKAVQKNDDGARHIPFTIWIKKFGVQ